MGAIEPIPRHNPLFSSLPDTRLDTPTQRTSHVGPYDHSGWNRDDKGDWSLFPVPLTGARDTLTGGRARMVQEGG